ncbi:hypothetical protein EVAR_70137_1 [Eumeta japonica]|uniref:Uncharacterized protein n=1 Tax=Eumeta variegata TaxID=151549 RepID=A0A4C1Z7J8_EUMVA|nr:hypothetical protein EVAR_70137_1 [Eumeta japonica]
MQLQRVRRQRVEATKRRSKENDDRPVETGGRRSCDCRAVNARAVRLPHGRDLVAKTSFNSSDECLRNFPQLTSSVSGYKVLANKHKFEIEAESYVIESQSVARAACQPRVFVCVSFGCVRPLSLFYSDASVDGVEERSLVPRSRSHARLRRNVTMSHAFPCVQPAFIDL